MVLVLPYLLNRILSQSDYAVWVLGFQAALYVPMFGLGIHQLLNRAIAHHLARDEHDQLHRNLASGLGIVMILSALAFCFVLIGSQFVTQIANADAVQDLGIQSVWMNVGIAASLGLLSLFFFGCFGGQQRYEWENLYKAMISIGFIALTLGALMAGVGLTPTLLSLLYLATIVVGLLFLAWRFSFQAQLEFPKLMDWHFPTAKSYFRGMYGLSFWQIGMLMVSGFDVWIVGKFDFAAIPGYAIGLSFLVFLGGSISAIAGPSLPRFSAEVGQVNLGLFKQLFLAHQKN